MSIHLTSLAVLVFSLSLALSVSAQNADEKLWLELINQARTQPKAFAEKHLAPLKAKNKNAAAMYDKLQSMKVRKAVQMEVGLNRAAKDAFKEKLGVDPDNYTKDIYGYGSGGSAGSMSVLEVVIENALSVLNPDYTHIGICIEATTPTVKKFSYFFATVGKIEREMEENYQRKYPELQSYKWNEKALNTGASASYLSSDEKTMILELNKVRQHPKQYIAYIEDYLVAQSQEWGLSYNELEAAEDLIKQLSEMQPVAILQPKLCVYTAAKLHGLDQQRRRSGGHTSSDGSDPWDRIYKACKGEMNLTRAYDSKGVVGNENLVGGSAAPREAVIQLLIDSGIPGYGHRHNMLDPLWKSVGCYFVGQINNMPNNWVQNFTR